jgi:hypothetical protein
MEYWYLSKARIGKVRLGIDRLEVGLYTAFLAQKRAHMGYFLEVTDLKTTNKGRIIMDPKWCCCNG